jgi:hypothetical protein
MRSAHFAGLAESLLRRGVAPRHVRRLVAELDAHLRDLVDELRARGLSPEQATLEARARLGSDDRLAASVLARPELQSWVQRRPWAAFAVVPVLSFLAVLVGSMVAFVFLVEGLKSLFGLGPQVWSPLRTLTPLLLTSMLWVLPGLAAAPYVWLAASRRVSAKWPVVGVVVIALIGATVNMGLEWPAPPARGAFSAGIGISTDNVIQPLVRAGLTMTLALVPLAWRRAKSAR